MNNDWYKNCFYRISVKALIRDQDGSILMVSEKGGDFALPGGGWDYEESLRECLARELHEEVDLRGDFDFQLLDALPFYNPGKQAWQMWLVCEVACDIDGIGVGAEADRVEWVSRDDIDTSTKAGQLVEQVLAGLEADQ